MLRAKKRDNLGNFRIAKRVAKGWHLLPAVQNLLRDLFLGPYFVLANFGKGRRF